MKLEWPQFRPKGPILCPQCRARVRQVVNHSYCAECGWNAQRLRSGVIVELMELIVAAALILGVKHAMDSYGGEHSTRAYIVVLGGFTFAVARLIYLRFTVPDLPAPSEFQRMRRLAKPVPRPAFRRARFSVMQFVDLIAASAFIFVGAVPATSAHCFAVVLNWKVSPILTLADCIFPLAPVLLGVAIIVRHWRQRLRESRLTREGAAALGQIVSVQDQGEHGSKIWFEFTDHAQGAHRGRLPRYSEIPFYEGQEVLVLYDTFNPNENVAVQSMRFFAVDRDSTK